MEYKSILLYRGRFPDRNCPSLRFSGTIVLALNASSAMEEDSEHNRKVPPSGKAILYQFTFASVLGIETKVVTIRLEDRDCIWGSYILSLFILLLVRTQ